jgi:hypothetical protein
MMLKPTYIDAIISLDPNAKCIYQNEDLSTLVWEDGNPNNITEKQITDKHAELMTEYNAQEYARKRQAEYPTIEELVVALYDTDDKAAIDAKRAAVKAKYPKGS